MNIPETPRVNRRPFFGVCFLILALGLHQDGMAQDRALSWGVGFLNSSAESLLSGSRHELVDRENRIILEYRAKDAYRIEYLGPAGQNYGRT
ncbi:MAG: hypothetical protein LBN96_06525 [Desulfovibrio sp.]|nr:hypothetical protein [Desulfovibrio sp.]